MQVTITAQNVYIDPGINKKLDQIINLLTQQKETLTTVMIDLSQLQQAVTDEKTVEDSVVTLLGTLSSKISELIAASGNAVDPAALQDIVNQINNNKAALAAAVTANTPAA